MKERIIMMLALLFLGLGSGVTYAYWSSGIDGNSDSDVIGSVTIGEGEAITTTVVVSDSVITGVELVPIGFEDAISVPEKVNTVMFTFSVNWSGLGAEGAEGVLSVSVNELRTETAGPTITIWEPNLSLYGGMFTITVLSGTGIIVAGTSQDVTIEVEFTNEPDDYAMYLLVVNGILEMDLTFLVTV